MTVAPSAPTLVLPAAGVGRRYGGAKQLEGQGPCGELLLEYSLYDARAAGFDRAVLVVRPEAETAFRRRLEGAARTLEIVYVHQPEPRGTGHAVLCARERVDGPFAVANADDVYGPGSFAAAARALTRAEDAHWFMVGFELERTLSPHGPVSRSLCRTDERGRLALLEEVLEVKEGRGLVSMNLWGFTPDVFDVLAEAWRAHGEGELFLPTVIGDRVAVGRAEVEILPSSEDWLGITWAEDRAWVRERLKDHVASGRYPSPLWSTP